MIQFKWKECYGCSSPTRCEAEKTCYIIAPRAAEAGEDDRFNPFTLAERWKDIHSDESYGPQGKNLGVLARAFLAARSRVQEIETSRPAIIEECARMCEDVGTQSAGWRDDFRQATQKCASAIRALAPGGQNAALRYDKATRSIPDRRSQKERRRIPPAPAEVAEGED
jgi:hypothetical protein